MRTKQFRHILTETQAYRPQKYTIWVNINVKSELEFEHTQFLHLDPNNEGKRPLSIYVRIEIVVAFLVVQLFGFWS